MYFIIAAFSVFGAVLAAKETRVADLHLPEEEEEEVVMLSMMIRNESVKTPARTEEASGPVLVKLKRKSASTWQNSTYVGSLYLGSPIPQHFEVSFDTASGQVVLPSSRCKSPACREHERYAPGASITAQDINSNGEPVKVDFGALTVKRDVITLGVDSLDHGAGKATGDLLHEKVCVGKTLGRGRCMELGIIAATELTDVPFRNMPSDGIVGLGMSTLATNPFFHLLGQLQPWPGSSKSFGLFLGENDGELALGGSNPSLQQPGQALHWASVHKPEEGYWQVSIRAVRLGNTTLACSHDSKEIVSGCRGIFDSSAAGIGVPSNLAADLSRLVGNRCGKDDLVLELEGSTLRLSPEEYQSHCSPMVSPTQLPEALSDVLILGQPFFRKYYMVFDWGEQKIGFAPAAPYVEASTEKEVVTVLSTAQAESLEQEAIAAEIKAREASGFAHKGSPLAAELLLEGLAIQLFVMMMLMLAVQRVQQDFPIFLRIRAARLSAKICSMLDLKLPKSWTFTSLFLAITPISEEEAPDAADCVVCLGVREDECKCKTRPNWCRLQCGHAFHEECIFEWLQKAPRCPICRSHVLGEEKQTAGPAEEGSASLP